MLPAKLEPTPATASSFSRRGRYTTVRRPVVTDVAAHSAVNVTCHGSGCPFASAGNVTGKECKGKPCQAKKSQVRRGHRTIDLTPLLAGSRLAPDALLSVSVTKANTIGRTWLFTIRAGKGPSRRISCLEPGSSVPGKGCSEPAR